MTAATFSMQGFRPFLRKEVSEWGQRRASAATFVGVTALGLLATLATRIDELASGSVPLAADLDPTANVIGAQFEQWVLFASIFGSIGLMIGERGSGTLAWTLSKPMSRSSFLLTKWVVAVVMLGLFGIALPLAVCVAVATLAYGSTPDLARVATLGIVLLALPAFFVALNLALSTRTNSQAGLAAIALGLAAVPAIFGGFVPVLAELWPTSMATLATVMASGGAPHFPTILSWLFVVIGLGVAGLIAFGREDL
jgi:ABC-type transport system involved in multi-copper enzyme maturation permease subunit